MCHDVELAYKTIKQYETEWHINPKQIFLCGFSAGGHLAAIAGSRLGKRKIKGVILGYPVMGAEYIRALDGKVRSALVRHRIVHLFRHSPLKEASRRTPPTFIWHTRRDVLVSPRGSLRYVEKLLQEKVPCELHLYQIGQHALSTATPDSARFKFQIQPHIATWVELVYPWIQYN